MHYLPIHRIIILFWFILKNLQKLKNLSNGQMSEIIEPFQINQFLLLGLQICMNKQINALLAHSQNNIFVLVYFEESTKAQLAFLTSSRPASAFSTSFFRDVFDLYFFTFIFHRNVFFPRKDCTAVVRVDTVTHFPDTRQSTSSNADLEHIVLRGSLRIRSIYKVGMRVGTLQMHWSQCDQCKVFAMDVTT